MVAHASGGTKVRLLDSPGSGVDFRELWRQLGANTAGKTFQQFRRATAHQNRREPRRLLPHSIGPASDHRALRKAAQRRARAPTKPCPTKRRARRCEASGGSQRLGEASVTCPTKSKC